MSACIIIPARYESSRFPGKPLAEINGKSMICWVIDACRGAVADTDIMVATDDERIGKLTSEYGCRTFMTPKDCKTGSDRIAEVAKLLDYDIIVGVQGDEPLIKPEDIKKVIEFKRIKHNSVICGYSWSRDFDNKNTIKVVTHGSGNDEMIYMSRQQIPTGVRLFKRQVCVYGWYKEQLLRMYGPERAKGVFEGQEDIEILRCLQYRQEVFMVEFKGKYQSVDIPSDIQKVEEIIKSNVK